MKNQKIKHIAILTACFFLNWQIIFAQNTTIKSFNFECGQSCNLNTDESNDVIVYYGNPLIRPASDCQSTNNSTKSLFLRFDYCQGSQDGADGVFLKYHFSSGKTYKISYKVATTVTNNMAFELDFDLVTNNSLSSITRTLGDIGNSPFISRCSNSTCALKPVLSNWTGMSRLTNFSSPSNGYFPNYSPDNNCNFISKTFNYTTNSNGDFIHIRLDRSGWDAPNYDSKTEIRLDDIIIEEVCDKNPDFKLKIVGTTAVSNTFAQTQNKFNFEVEPVIQDGLSYKLEIYKSINQGSNSNFVNSSICTVNYYGSSPGILKTATERGANGFLSEENQTGTCLFYKIKLTIETRCGETITMCRIVKSCYNGNILNQDVSIMPYNKSFDYTLSDDNAGINRTKTFIGIGKYAPWSYIWVSGYDDIQSGAYQPDIVGSSSSPTHIETFRPMPTFGEYVRVRNAYWDYSVNNYSTIDAVVFYDRLDPNCDGIVINSEPQSQATITLPTFKPLILKNIINIYPNPTTGQAMIQYSLLQFDKINISVTDITGKIVSQLVENKNQEAGTYEILFEKKDIPKGMYFVIMENSQGKIVKKLILQ